MRHMYIGEKNNYAECLIIAGEAPCSAAMPIRIKSRGQMRRSKTTGVTDPRLLQLQPEERLDVTPFLTGRSQDHVEKTDHRNGNRHVRPKFQLGFPTHAGSISPKQRSGEFS